MHMLRTRFKGEIVAEFLPPRKRSNKVIIFCDGMPGTPSKKSLLQFFSKKGYWVFHPRYRGAWESKGNFLKISPEKDILDVIDQIPKGFTGIWSGKRYRVRPGAIYLFASSFGGPAAILASRDKRITKVIVFSPVVDWRAPSKAEPLDWLFGFTREAFGEAYRISRKNWNKLKTGIFYNPAAHAQEIDGRKLFIIHAKDDASVRFREVKNFAETVGAELLALKRGEHLSSSNFINPRFYGRIMKFIRKKT